MYMCTYWIFCLLVQNIYEIEMEISGIFFEINVPLLVDVQRLQKYSKLYCLSILSICEALRLTLGVPTFDQRLPDLAG